MGPNRTQTSLQSKGHRTVISLHIHAQHTHMKQEAGAEGKQDDTVHPGRHGKQTLKYLVSVTLRKEPPCTREFWMNSFL